MALKKMIEIEMKYGFPNFTRVTGNIKLCDSQKIIISDIWSFWDYVIKKNNFDKPFMSSLLEQAKFFYTTAENSPIKSQPLLYYYSFLNFAKIIVNIQNRYGKTNCKYLHGISQKDSTKFSKATIIISPINEYRKNISAELANALDEQQICTNVSINVRELLTHCVGIHRTYSEIYNQKETFCRLKNLKLFKYGSQLIFEAEVKCNFDQNLELISLGYNIECENNQYFWRERHNLHQNHVTRQDYYNFSKELRNKGIWYYIGNTGYVNYISTSNKSRYAQEFITFNFMFFLGSITRYYPYLFDEIFSDKEQWLMSEFLATQPKQFIFTSTAKILSQQVIKAYSDF